MKLTIINFPFIIRNISTVLARTFTIWVHPGFLWGPYNSSLVFCGTTRTYSLVFVSFYLFSHVFVFHIIWWCFLYPLTFWIYTGSLASKLFVCVCGCVCVCTLSASHWKNKSVLYFPPDSVVNYKTWLVIWNREHLILQK